MHHRFWMLVITLAFMVSFPGAAVTHSSQVCDEAEGTVERHSYRSAISQTNMVYSIYTPPCYGLDNHLYPVLYLMHGSNEDDSQWIRLGIQEILDMGVADGSLPPMIVVLPFGNWIANENQFDSVSWENVFLTELLPLVEARYRVDPKRDARAIGGISRGGFWAFEIAFRHPDLFSAVGGHSAFFAEGNAPPEYDPLKLARSAANIETLYIWLDRGADDYAKDGLDLMSERLTHRDIQHEYTIYPEGQHTNDYWRQHAREYLLFYARIWQSIHTVPTDMPFVFATNTPTAAGSPQPDTSNTYIFLPAVSFPSLQTSISREALDSVRHGQSDSRLVIDETTAAQFQEYGVQTSGIQIVPDGSLLAALWRDRKQYTLLAFERLTPRYRVLHLDDLHPFDTDLADYPFAFQSAAPNYDPQRLTRIALSGVTALTRLTREALDQKGTLWAGEALKPYVERADFFHTSNEVSFSPKCPESDGAPPGEFCAKEAHFNLLIQLGLDIVELTGNHNNDFGIDSYLETLKWYRENGIQITGGGENLEQARQPLIIEHHGNRITILACNWAGPYYALATESQPGAAACDWNWLHGIVPQLASQSHVLIVTIQYQEYEDYKPTPEQEADFKGLADLGADVVIGTQAHKPQIFEFYNSRRGIESFIHYGLGNLFFDQPFWGNSRFFMDQLFIYDGRLLSVDLFTGIIEENARPRPMTPDEQLNFLAFMFNTQAGY
jgi:poly-gamma-glutamate synthesis protein (capsule biosynthesis protein)